MSIFGTLQTAVSGMAAQSNRIGTIGENIANSGTTGYKGASTEFETLVGNEGANSFHPSGVSTLVRYGVTDQGELNSTTSVTDLAIKGNGFFLVRDASGAQVMTRAGAFVPDQNGNLVNTAGDTLLGYNLQDGTYDPLSGTGTLEPVNISSKFLSATASKTGQLTVNLPSTATAVVAADLPSANASTATYDAKASLVAYDNLGTPVNLDVYMTNTGSNTWEATVYNAADAHTGGGFPYSSAALTTENLTFDATTGSLATTSPNSLSVAVPNGNTVKIDLSQTSQLAAAYAVDTATLDGNAPAKVDKVTIGQDGTVSAVYTTGTITNTFRIPLASVRSPDNLTVQNGNNYQVNQQSGDMTIGAASAGGLGNIDSSTLESSTIDIATELTNMITTQSAYQANSKVLTTGSTMLSTLIQAIQ